MMASKIGFYSNFKTGVLSILPKIPGILVRIQMESLLTVIFGSPLEVVHLLQSEYSDQNLPYDSIFDKCSSFPKLENLEKD